MSARKDVVKTFRLEKNLAKLLELLAASHGESFSDFARRVLAKALVEDEAFLKGRIRQLLNVLSRIEKEHDPKLVQRAKIAASLYPLEGAGLEYYVAVEKASRAAEELTKLGFAKDFAEELCRNYFTGSAEERIAFHKSLEDFVRDVERRERLADTYRWAHKIIFGGGDER